MFKIKCISISKSPAYGMESAQVQVRVEVDAKAWTKMKKQGELGQLYGIDICNQVSELSRRLIPAYRPTVSDTARASKGIKQISLYFYMDDLNKAEQLGLEVTTLRNGTKMIGYGAYAIIFDGTRPTLSIVKSA